MKKYSTNNLLLDLIIYVIALPIILLILLVKLIIISIKGIKKLKEKSENNFNRQINKQLYKSEKKQIKRDNNYNEYTNYSNLIKINDIENTDKNYNNQYEETNEKQINGLIYNQPNNENKYKTKKLITDNEKYFYDIIEKHFGNTYRIQTQVNLASIIDKIKNNPREYQNELFRNIDIGIFARNFTPLLLIEINDSTHNRPKRQYRDIRVKEICEEAGIKLITFYTNMSNKEDYIVNRIENEL